MQKRGGGEGTANAVMSTTASTIVFNGLGRAAGGAGPVQIDVSNPSGGLCQTAGGPMRCLRVNVASGGDVRMCDPAVLDNTDPRFCN